MLNVRIIGCRINTEKKRVARIDEGYNIANDDINGIGILAEVIDIDKALIFNSNEEIIGIYHRGSIIELDSNKSVIQSHVDRGFEAVRFIGYNLDKDIPRVCDIELLNSKYCKEFIDTGLYTDGVAIENDYKVIYVVDMGKVYTAKQYANKRIKEKSNPTK